MKHEGPANVEDAATATQPNSRLQEGIDYYIEDGLFVFTATFLQRRGYCCESGCRHCPYDYSGESTKAQS